MSEREVENSLKWTLKCQECKAGLCGRGVKSVLYADMFASDHAEKTGHKMFDMDVLAHSISIEVMEGPCGKNLEKK